MTELDLLRLLLVASMAVAPLGTHRLLFPTPSTRRTAAHASALACAAGGLFLPAPALCVPWLVFCVVTFVQYVLRRLDTRRTLSDLATCVPFVFGIIAATWLVSGAHDWRLLGYGPTFSYYAALHGNVLGWTLVGAIAILADQHPGHRRVYVAAVFVCLVSFLLIALGIDQLRALKPIGVVGLSLAIPTAQLVFLRDVWPRSKAAFALAAVSLGGLLFTMLLAWRNELALPVLPLALDIRAMVSVHGVVNAVVVAPAFLLAVALQRPVVEPSTNSSPSGGERPDR